MSRAAFAVLFAPLALLTGCADAFFTEADDGEIREVSQGAEFTISLPSLKPSQPPRPAPTVQGAFVQLLERSVDQDDGREKFRFNAVGAGDSEIRIASAAALPEASEKEFLIRVRIRPTSTKPKPSGTSGYK